MVVITDVSDWMSRILMFKVWDSNVTSSDSIIGEFAITGGFLAHLKSLGNDIFPLRQNWADKQSPSSGFLEVIYVCFYIYICINIFLLLFLLLFFKVLNDFILFFFFRTLFYVLLFLFIEVCIYLFSMTPPPLSFFLFNPYIRLCYHYKLQSLLFLSLQ